MKHRNITCTVAIVAAMIAASATSFAQEAEKLARGKAILELNCLRCHATGAVDKSTLPKAPPFRDLNRRYDVALLAESFAEGIVTGHPDMPVFVFNPEEIEAIIGYMKSLPKS